MAIDAIETAMPEWALWGLAAIHGQVIGLPNPDHSVAKLYGQQVRLIKLGRMPALVIVDKGGKVYYQHHGNSMSDIPENERVLALLDELNASQV